MDGVACGSCDCFVQVGCGIEGREGGLFGQTLDGLAWDMLEAIGFGEDKAKIPRGLTLRITCFEAIVME
jgi:hypothetical protein